MEDENKENGNAEQLKRSLEQLDEQGELDSENITFNVTGMGGVHLDDLDTALEDVGYEKDPVQITIEPQSSVPEDHHYYITFDYLDRDSDGNYVSGDRDARVDGLEEHLRDHDALVPTEIPDAPDIGVKRNGVLTFEVEADTVEFERSGRDYAEYQMPEDVIDLVNDFGGEVRGATCYPDGRGWGEPTYAIRVVVE